MVLPLGLYGAVSTGEPCSYIQLTKSFLILDRVLKTQRLHFLQCYSKYLQKVVSGKSEVFREGEELL